MQIWRRRRRTACEEADGKCEFNVAHEMVHNGLDGKVFRVRRLVCARCGEQIRVAKEQTLRAARGCGRAVEAKLLRVHCE